MFHFIVAVIQGIVEGLTEFLPVSSTGHLILTGNLLGFTGDKADTFEVVIQLGAILAIVVLYWKRYLRLLGLMKDHSPESKGRPHLNLLHIIIACFPAMLMGLILNKVIKNYLFSPYTVLIGLVVGGVYMIVAERKHKPASVDTMEGLTYKQAFQIGCFQCLALWPGFSRSGATIAGGMLVGTSYRAATNFSFLIAVPMMVAASGFDLLKSYKTLTSHDLGYMAIGFVVAFIVALMAVVSFLKLLNKLNLTTFAYYRFVIAVIFGIYLLVR